MFPKYWIKDFCPGIDNNLKCRLIDLLTNTPLHMWEIQVEMCRDINNSHYADLVEEKVWELVDVGRLLYIEDRKFITRE